MEVIYICLWDGVLLYSGRHELILKCGARVKLQLYLLRHFYFIIFESDSGIIFYFLVSLGQRVN